MQGTISIPKSRDAPILFLEASLSFLHHFLHPRPNRTKSVAAMRNAIVLMQRHQNLSRRIPKLASLSTSCTFAQEQTLPPSMARNCTSSSSVRGDDKLYVQARILLVAQKDIESLTSSRRIGTLLLAIKKSWIRSEVISKEESERLTLQRKHAEQERNEIMKNMIDREIGFHQRALKHLSTILRSIQISKKLSTIRKKLDVDALEPCPRLTSEERKIVKRALSEFGKSARRRDVFDIIAIVALAQWIESCLFSYRDEWGYDS